MASLRVKIGDTIEFAPLGNGSEMSASMTMGRVMDVHPSEPELCTVQISPYEPLRTINLRNHICKIVYAVGDVSVLTPEMMGWQIEIANDAQQIVSAVIKRVDLDINCALVAFESGKKEWLDLALSLFKVLVQTSELNSEQDENSGHQKECRHNETQSPVLHNLIVNPQQDHGHEEINTVGGHAADPVDETDYIHFQQLAVPPLDVPTRSIDSYSGSSDDLSTTTYTSKSPPESDVTSFDWYSEGGHVEICDPHGGFIEGAILCSKTDSHVQLYNETHQFFEISMVTQSFKVIVHGLLSLKWIPMGQAIEVYSAMTGGFHQGIVIKAAEVSKLTPIRFANGGAVEWLDLSTQTFKLVFLSEPDQVSDAIGNGLHSEEPLSQMHKPHSHHHHHNHHHHRADATAVAQLALPSLRVGQRIEIFDAGTKQFAKFKVANVSESVPHEYEFEPHSETSSSSSSESVIRNLAKLRCRIPLHPQMWEEYREILPGHRIDVFDKAEKTVANAKILEVGSAENQHSILVRYKDGKKSWIHPQDVKVRLRLQGELLDARKNSFADQQTSATEVASSHPTNGNSELDPIGGDRTEMWERPAIPAETSHESGHHHHQQLAPLNKTRLSRNRSDLARLSSQADDIVAQAQLTHYASTNDILTAERSIEIDSIAMTQQIPSIVQPLDFSSLRKLRPAAEREEAVYSVAPELNVNSYLSSRSSARSRKSDSASTSGRLPFSMDDVWREEVDPALNLIEYVHNTSGAIQTQVPEWLERSDLSTGKLFVVHTPTNTLYSVPSSSSDSNTSNSNNGIARSDSSGQGSMHGGSSSPGDCGGRVVVPIGPIEAVRVYNMLDK